MCCVLFLHANAAFGSSMYSLGQACNHVAALLFYLESHRCSGAKPLPIDLSKPSQPIKWNQVPRKVVAPLAVRDMSFVKASHGEKDGSPTPTEPDNAAEYDGADVKLTRSQSDPHRSADRSLDENRRDNLLEALTAAHPQNGLQHFWSASPHPHVTAVAHHITNMWQKYIIFWHKDASSIDVCQLRVLTFADLEDFVSCITLSKTGVAEIENATRVQADSKLWLALHNGRLTGSVFGEMLRRRDTTDPPQSREKNHWIQ